MKVEIGTRLFQLKPEYKSTELARMFGLSQCQVCRVKRGEKRVSADFIAGALRAFPEHKFEDLFYIKRKLLPIGRRKLALC